MKENLSEEELSLYDELDQIYQTKNKNAESKRKLTVGSFEICGFQLEVSLLVLPQAWKFIRDGKLFVEREVPTKYTGTGICSYSERMEVNWIRTIFISRRFPFYQ